MMTTTKPKTLTLRPHELARLDSAGSVCVVRVMRKQPDPLGYEYVSDDSRVLERWPWTRESILRDFPCPFGRVGDVVVVKEAFSLSTETRGLGGSYTSINPRVYTGIRVWYRANNDRPTWAETRWRSPATMPAWAIRTHLTLASVDARRVQTVTAIESFAAGVMPRDQWPNQDAVVRGDAGDVLVKNYQQSNATEVLAQQHDAHTRNPAHKYDANPWVWIGTFTRSER